MVFNSNKPWTYVETRTRIKGTNEYYKIKIDLEDLHILKDKAIYVCRRSKCSYVVFKYLVGCCVEVEKSSVLSRAIKNVKHTEHNKVIKHINGDYLDLCKDNLKVVSSSENRLTATNNKKRNLPKGVYIKDKKYIASIICLNKTKIHLGYFNTVEDAEKAYNLAKYEYLNNLKQA